VETIVAAGATDARLFRCPACAAELVTPIACGRCGRLLSPYPLPDHFALLRLTRTYRVPEADLERVYLKSSRLVHPDFFADRPRHEQEQAGRLSALLNEAYRTLASPVARAEYLLRLRGGPTATSERATPPGFLGEMLALREEAEDPGIAPERRSELLAQVGARIAAVMGDLAGLFDAPDGGAERTRDIRLALNSYYYLETLRESLGGEQRLRR
jgi:molecular chaperone HscB